MYRFLVKLLERMHVRAAKYLAMLHSMLDKHDRYMAGSLLRKTTAPIAMHIASMHSKLEQKNAALRAERSIASIAKKLGRVNASNAGVRAAFSASEDSRPA